MMAIHLNGRRAGAKEIALQPVPAQSAAVLIARTTPSPPQHLRHDAANQAHSNDYGVGKCAFMDGYAWLTWIRYSTINPSTAAPAKAYANTV